MNRSAKNEPDLEGIGTHLRSWTPVALRMDEPCILEWADLRDHAFDKPFFFHTLKAWRAGHPAPLVETGLAALAALDSEPSRDPDLIIAHPSRCGSTLLARLAAAAQEQTMLVSEPDILFHFLQASLARPLEAPEPLLRHLVRALGRIRFGTEKGYILKLSSRMSRFLPAFRRAFPGAPIVWVQRDPAAIVGSNLRAPPMALAGLPRDEVGRLALRNITLAFLAAAGFADSNFHVVDHRDLPDAAWARIAPLMGLRPTEADLVRMRAVSRIRAQDGTPYVPRTPDPLPAPIRAMVRETLDPLYEALARRAVS